MCTHLKQFSLSHYQPFFYPFANRLILYLFYQYVRGIKTDDDCILLLSTFLFCSHAAPAPSTFSMQWGSQTDASTTIGSAKY